LQAERRLEKTIETAELQVFRDAVTNLLLDGVLLLHVMDGRLDGRRVCRLARPD
jgi:hypothetical protein